MATIVGNGSVEQLQRALPKDKALRKALVCGEGLLLRACIMGRLDMAAALVREHCHPVDLADPQFGVTALLQMCYLGSSFSVLFLVRTLGASPRAQDKKGDTAMGFACDQGHTGLALMLAREFALSSTSANHKGSTPLHKAAGGGYTGTVLALINDLRARVNVADTGGTTPLMSAAQWGHASTAAALISIGGACIDAADQWGQTALHWASSCGQTIVVCVLLGEGARMDAKAEHGKTPQQEICLRPTANPAAKPLVLAAFVRHARLERLGGEVLRLASTWDHDSLKRAIDALMAAAAQPWAASAAVAKAAQAEHWTSPRHPLDMFREPGTGRTALAVAAATGIFRNAELLIQAAASPLELDCNGRTPWQLALSAGSELMGVWFESMPIVYWAGHSQLRYRPAAATFLLCCRFSRMRAPPVPPADEAHPIPGISCMHPDDWCIPRRDVYRILHFVGPELLGSVWPGPPRGYRGPLPGLSPRPVRRLPPRLQLGTGGAVAAPVAVVAAPVPAGCAQCGTTAGKLLVCTRCHTASYCSGKCQKLHYPAHKAGCRAAGTARDGGASQS